MHATRTGAKNMESLEQKNIKPTKCLTKRSKAKQNKSRIHLRVGPLFWPKKYRHQPLDAARNQKKM